MQDYTDRMKKLLFVNFFAAVCWARPDASHLTTNRHFHHQIESIKPSIHIASFSIRTEVPLNRGISPHQLSQSLENSYFTSQNTQFSTIPSQRQSYAPPSSSHPSIQQPSQAQVSAYNPRAYLPPEPTQQQQNPAVSHKQIYNAPIQPTYVPQTIPKPEQMFLNSAPIRQAKQQFRAEEYLPPAPTQQKKSLEAHQQQTHQYSNLEEQKTEFEQQEVMKGGYLPPERQTYASPQPEQISQYSPSSAQQFVYATPGPETPRYTSNPPDLQAFVSSAPAQQSFEPQTQSQQSFKPPASSQQSFGPQTQSQQSFEPPAHAQQSFGPQTQSQQSFEPPAPAQQSFGPQTQSHQSLQSIHQFISAAPTQAQLSVDPSSQIQQPFVPQIITQFQQSFKPSAATQQPLVPSSQINQSSVPAAPAPVQAQQSFVAPTQMHQTLALPFSAQQSSIHQSPVSQMTIQQFSLPPITQQGTYTPQKPVSRTYLPTLQFIFHTTDKEHVAPIHRDISPQQSIMQQTSLPPKQADPQEYSTSAADFDYDAFVPPPPPSQNIEKKNFDSSRDTNGYLPPISISQDYNVPRSNQQSHFSQTSSEQDYSAPASPQNAAQAQNTQTLSHVEQSYSRQDSISPANLPQKPSPTQQIFTQAQRPGPASIQRHYSPPQSGQQEAPMEQSVPKSQIKELISFDPSKMQNLQPFFVVQLPQPTHPNLGGQLKEHSHGSPQYSSNPASFNDHSPSQVFSGQQSSSISSSTSDSFDNYETKNSMEQSLATAPVINPAITTQANIQDFGSVRFEGHLKDANHRSSDARQFASQMTDTFGSSNAVQGHNSLDAQYASNGGYTYQRK